MRTTLGGTARLPFVAVVTAAMLTLAAPARAQKNKKDKPPLAGQPMPAMPLPPSDQIDHDIGEMLGAFQVGDVEAMHKYYADNAVFVSGAYEPPLVGWQNYAAVYQRQRAAFTGMQLVRRNTVVFLHTDVAWASYQWEFASMVGDRPYTAHGQTTLVLNKVSDRWVIVHNHTSEICGQPAAAAQQPQQGPQQRPAAPQQQAPAPPKPQN